MSLTHGQTFAGYTIIRLLGSGGMGEVYLAQHPRLPRRDALKLLPREWSADAEFRARFNREADLASTLWHPHIVGVHDRGEADGQLWISMDFVDGLDGARLLADRYRAGMPVQEVVRIVTAVASALDYAHKENLLHRDVKPANIMMTRVDDDREQRILLTDFGIARNTNDISGLTKTNMTVGTVAYCAPEQLLGEGIDGRADQYSLAATAFNLLTGSQLFPSSNPAVVISHHLNVSPPAVADFRPELAELDSVLAIGLAKRPEGRFERCSDFARALADQVSRHSSESGLTATKPATVLGSSAASASLSQSQPVAPGIPATRLARKRAQGRRLQWAAVLAVVLIGVFALVWHPWTKNTASSPSYTSSPAGTTTMATSRTTPTSTSTSTPTAMPAIIEVDPAEYEDRESPGYYRWVYARTPFYKDCAIFPVAAKSTEPEGLSCSVTFPPGTPEISNPPFNGPPNEVKIILPDGPENSLSEGGPPTAKTLLPNHRITVGVFSCTALPGGGIECDGPTGGFRFADGVVTKHGAR